jgi:hypothetical protein
VEYNVLDVRSKKAIHDTLGDITGSGSIQFATKGKANDHRPHQHQKRCIIMDEVDGMGGSNRGGVAELILLIKGSRVPIICICNDRQSQNSNRSCCIAWISSFVIPPRMLWPSERWKWEPTRDLAWNTMPPKPWWNPGAMTCSRS